MGRNKHSNKPDTLQEHLTKTYKPTQSVNTRLEPQHVNCTEAFTLVFPVANAPSYEEIKEKTEEYFTQYGQGSCEIRIESKKRDTKIFDALCSSYLLYGFSDLEGRVVVMRDSRKKRQGIIEVRGIELMRIRPPASIAGMFF